MDYYNDEYLMHYGVKGMKWGVRRYQNKDGSLTPAGKKRQQNSHPRDVRLNKAQRYGKKAIDAYQKLDEEYNKAYNKAIETNDWETFNKFENDYNKRLDKELYEPLYKAGYDYVHRGGGSNGLLSIQFGKYLDEPVYNSYGLDIWVDEYLADNSGTPVYRRDVDDM